MAPQPLTNNQYAAALAFWAGLVFLAIGWNGTRIYEGFVRLLAAAIPGTNPGLQVVPVALTLISPLSAAFVAAGATLRVMNRDPDVKVVVLFEDVAGRIAHTL